jgi:hypothetical protein
MPLRHCTGCFAALPAWPPPRCPRCRRATYTLWVRRALMASALTVIAGCGIWLWVKWSNSASDSPAETNPPPAVPVAGQTEP